MSEKLKQPHGKRYPNGWLTNNNQPCAIRTLPKCQARSKSTGARCGNLAVKGKRVCWLHGGRSPGAPPGNSHARKHGGYTAKAVASRKYVRQLINKMRDTMAAIDRADQNKPNE
jgi:hypothetical protein